MAFPFIPVLALIGLGTAGYYAFKKPSPQPAPGGVVYHPGGLPAPSPPGGNPVLNLPAPNAPGGAINIELPVGIASDVYTVVNAPNQLLLRSSALIDGHAPGQGNVVGALPNDTIVKKMAGTEIKNKTADNPGGFMNIQTLTGQIGWAAADYLAKADVVQGVSV